MGFWQGLDAGLTAHLEEKARQKERQQEIDLRIAERDEERSWREKQETANFIRQQGLAAIPLLVERKEQEKTIAAQRAQLGGFFKNRLTDLPEETRDAFSNLALQAPSYSEALISEVKKVETEVGRQITGSEILKMTSLIETTKPEGMSLEEWTKQAASMTVTSGSSIDFDETLANLLSGDLGVQDLQEIQVGLMTPLGGDLSVIPDFDTSAVIGADPQVSIQLRNLAVTTMQDQFQADRAATDQQYKIATEGGSMPDEALEAKNMELGRIAALEGEEKEAALFNYYAPTILPQLAVTYPRVRAVFPQYFPSTNQAEAQPTISYDWVDGKLVAVTQ
jgi:hypothetical protein